MPPKMLVTVGITDKPHYRLGVRHHPGSDPDWHLLPSGFDDPLKAYDMMHAISAGNPDRIRIFHVEPVDIDLIQALDAARQGRTDPVSAADVSDSPPTS